LTDTHYDASVLGDVLDRAHALKGAARPAVVVFDLDGCLFDNGPRTWEILDEFAESTGRASVRTGLERLPRRGLPYTLEDIFAKAGVTDPAVVQAAKPFWMKRFFTDDYIKYDVPNVGAVGYVKSLYGAGATVVYLTGRDAPGMLVGTEASLRQHAFPVGVAHCVTVTKPDFETPDVTFKQDALPFVDTLGTVVGAFDNEPGNCNVFRRRWSEAEVVLLDTTHSPDAPPLLDGIKRVPDFSGARV
jgi:phosphoglycolate phosphatase-like HAD superfamily hydrolase